MSEEYDQPDLSRVLASMKQNRHFTLLLAWRRYVDTKDAGKKYGYSQFCALFTDYLRTHDLVAVLRHEPGRAMLVDWAGDTMDVVDTVTGEVIRAVLFVAVLPFSGAMFCRAYEDMKPPAWLDAHVQSFAFFGGVAQIVVPDNPTTSTHQTHKGDAERVVNARYQQLADHYQTAIVPARVKKPRDKAAAENTMNVVNKRVIGYLNDDVFTTLSELNEAIEERVREINHDLRRADDTTRWERFKTEEAAFLGPLPDAGFEDVEWKELKAPRNYHVTADTQRYSVPFALAGRLLRVRLTSSRVTVFDGHESICEHPRLTGRKGQYSTLPEHVPPQHRRAVVPALVHRPGPQRGAGNSASHRADPRRASDRGAGLFGLPEHPRRARQEQPGTPGGGLPGTREPPRPSDLYDPEAPDGGDRQRREKASAGGPGGLDTQTRQHHHFPRHRPGRLCSRRLPLCTRVTADLYFDVVKDQRLNDDVSAAYARAFSA